MQLVSLICLAVFGCSSATSPVQKVIEMLSEMKAKGTQEMAIEKEVFKDFSDFSSARTTELEQEITTATANIEKLTAIAVKADSDVKELTGRISGLDAEMAQLEAEEKSATELRDGERQEFLKDQTDYTESLYALDRAIQVLQAQSMDQPQAAVLLQRMATTLPGMGRVLAQLSLLQEGGEQPSGAPAVAAYEFQSSGIVTLLKQMRLRFKTELGDLEKEEMNKAHAYSLAVLHLGNTVEQLKSERESDAESRARIAAAGAAAKGELADTKASLADAEKFLSDLKAATAAKTATFEANQKLREDELAAIGEAITIISSPEVADAYATRIKAAALLQQHDQRPRSFLQLGSKRRRLTASGRAAAYLQGRAAALNSRALASVVAQLTENPFAKVTDMIKNLLARLKEEAASEAEHKQYCDEELKKNKLKRDEKTSDVAQLEAQIAGQDVKIVQMGDEIASLAAAQAALNKALAEATAVRSKEKPENEAAIADAQAGQTAVKQAILVLEEFYSQAGGFVQLKKQIPDFGLREYKGIQGKSGGVVGMLQVIESDFARLEADTQAAESQAAAEYAQFATDTKADLEAKHNAEFKLSLRKDQAEFEREQAQKDLDLTRDQLAAANSYYQELKPQCVVVHVSFAERAKRREEEIASLQQAYRILNGESA